MKRFPWILLSAIAVGSALLAWSTVREPYPQAPWISLKAPRYAVVDHSLTFRATIPPSTNSGWIIARLNWSDSIGKSGGFLHQTPPQAVSTQGGTFLLEFPVPFQTNMGQVNALICLSPAPKRTRQSQYVQTASLPVRKPGTVPDTRWRQLHAHVPVADPEIRPRETIWARWLTSGVWLAAAWQAGRRRLTPGKDTLWNPRWLWACCLGFALLEPYRADLAVASKLRAYARNHQLYERRHDYQKPAMLAAAGLVATATVWTLRRPRDPSQLATRASLGIFALFWLANVVSFHETDRLLALQLGMLPLVQWMKLLGAAGVLWALTRRESNQLPGLP